jgi:hypothetical protein
MEGRGMSRIFIIKYPKAEDALSISYKIIQTKSIISIVKIIWLPRYPNSRINKIRYLKYTTELGYVI